MFVLQVTIILLLIGECHNDPLTLRTQETTKVMEKWKKEKIRRNAYRVKWEKEKEENARLSGKLSTDGTMRAEFWKI